MKGALVVFVKTPGLSPVKTRLAKGIGSENAKTFFVKSVKAVESIAHRILKNNDVDCHPHWAVAENDGLSHELWKISHRYLLDMVIWANDYIRCIPH